MLPVALLTFYLTPPSSPKLIPDQQILANNWCIDIYDVWVFSNIVHHPESTDKFISILILQEPNLKDFLIKNVFMLRNKYNFDWDILRSTSSFQALIKFTEQSLALKRVSHLHFGQYMTFCLALTSGQDVHFRHILLNDIKSQTAMKLSDQIHAPEKINPTLFVLSGQWHISWFVSRIP